ncbi:MAG: hypothetical protein AB7E81_20420 [Hyphomicrobiaceae bacterium]
MTFLAIRHVTGADALGVAGSLTSKWLSHFGATIARLVGSSAQVLARGIGWRRLSRTVTTVAGIRLGYAASVVMSDNGVDRARDWRINLRTFLRKLGARWRRLPLLLKLSVVAALIASQIYLHFVLILFPIGFMIPIARRVFVTVADRLIGTWYWRSFGAVHHKLMAWLRRWPGVRHAIEGRRLLRLRYLRAWRLWRHDPRYRDPATNKRRKSLIEPIRLWRRHELDTYVGRPLLSGGRHISREPTSEPMERMKQIGE